MSDWAPLSPLGHSGSEPLAISAHVAAELLSISERHLWTLHSSGRLPAPVRLGRAVRWRREELEQWLAAGAPPRDQWEVQRGGGSS